MTKLYLIDQRDSFVYNLVQILREQCGAAVTVVAEEALADCSALEGADGVVLSPGPGVVAEHEAVLELLRRAPDLPFLGICMGLQEIGTLGGMELCRLDRPRHGVASPVVWTDGRQMEGARYHSWALRETPRSRDAIEVTARTADDGTVMAIRHRTLPREGWQFHPESILTPEGPALLRRWCDGLKQRK